MYIFVISPTAEATGLRLGDRITAVDGERISSLREARGALSRTGSRSHRVDVDRTGETITVDVPCVDEAPRWTATRRVFETAARGDWDGCLAAVNDAQRADGTARSLWARWRGRCVEAKNRLQNRPPDIWEAQLHYEFFRLRIREASYVPGSLDGIRGQILAGVTVLRQWGYTSLASDLEQLMERAVKGNVAEATPKSNKPDATKSSGTGFFIRPDGMMMTAYHVVRGAKDITLKCPGRQPVSATVAETASNVDLAILRAPAASSSYLPLAEARAVHQGDAVFTIGFPVPQILGEDSKFTAGAISSLSGPGGEATLLQITVPVQPGNSGGPLLNDAGQVVGVVTSSAAVVPFLAATGTLPQNVNWAIKAEYGRPLFDQPAAVAASKNRSEAIEHARRTVCLIEVAR